MNNNISSSQQVAAQHHHSTQLGHRRHPSTTPITSTSAPTTTTTTTSLGTNNNTTAGGGGGVESSYYYKTNPQHHSTGNTTDTNTDSGIAMTNRAGEPYRRTYAGGNPSSTFGLSSPYSIPTSMAGGTSSTTGTSSSSINSTLLLQLDQQRQKNGLVVITILGPTIAGVLYSTDSTYPLLTFLLISLIVYGLDLANQRDYIIPVMWSAVPLLTLLSGWFWLMELDQSDMTNTATRRRMNQNIHRGRHGAGVGHNRADDVDNGWRALQAIFQMGTTALFYICLAAYCSLQMDWLLIKYRQVCRQLESSIHGLIPPVGASLITTLLVSSPWVHIGPISANHHHRIFDHDTTVLLSPLCFAVILTMLMLIVGTCPSTTHTTTDKLEQHRQGQEEDLISKGQGPDSITSGMVYAIPPSIAYLHVVVLAITPPTMHIANNLGRFLSPYTSMDDIYDFILAFAIPYGLLMIISALHHSSICPSPYGHVSLLLHKGPTLSTTTALIRLAAILITVWSFQQRYMIPVAHWFSFHFMGQKSPAWLLSLYGMLAALSLTAAAFLWGNRLTVPSTSLLGEYHEDIVQLCLAIAGMSLGKAFGMAWNLTPLPVLAILGLSVWLLTRMLRYLAIFLFVVHAAGLVAFTYRFAGISDQFMQLPGLPPHVKLTLTQFGMVIISSSIVIGLVAGLGVRSTGGFLALPMKRWDITGWIFLTYTFMLIELEISLLKRPYPVKELAGIQPEEVTDEDMRVALYDPFWSLMTSMLLVALSFFMKRVRIISTRMAWVVLALAIGKAIAMYIDLFDFRSFARTSTSTNTADTGTDVLIHTLIASFVCIILIAPSVVLQPVRIKTSTRYKNYLSGGPELPMSTTRTILIYMFVLMPMAVVVAVPFVIAPLAQLMAAHYSGDIEYYRVSMPVSEFIGPAIAMWGIACLSMLNHLLPDGGGEVWKRLAALAFVSGILLYIVAPTLGFNVGDAASSPYAAVSSLGSQLLLRSKSRTGGWGLFSASIAALLAILGPLELKEKRRVSGNKDQSLLLRTMIFSLLFGGGVAWFITVQNMNQVEWVHLFLVVIATMAISFLGTVAAVCGHFLDLDNMDEVAQLVKMWVISFPVFLIVCGAPEMLLLSSSSTHLFGTGGWLATYLTISCLTTLAFSLSLRLRPDKDANTRGMANVACLFSWLCAISIVLGRYGVAGLNDTYTSVSTVFGVAAPVVGTLMVAPILLVLEGETSSRGSTRRISSGQKTRKSITWVLNLAVLKRTNRFAPLFFATSAIFICASLHAIVIRGSMLFPIPLGSAILLRQESGIATGKAVDELAALASKAVFSNQALTLSAKLADASIWTTRNLIRPILHLIGVIATLPNLYLCMLRWWWPPFSSIGDLNRPATVSSPQIYLALPLNAIPLLLCRGIPCLWAAAFLSASGGCLQLLLRWRLDRESRMQI